jgi:hypothetical protein
MAKSNQAAITDKNLERLTRLILSELEQPNLDEQIPDGAYIFHGAYNESELTQANIEMAANKLISMLIGRDEPAPLIMVFEYAPEQYRVIDLSNESRQRLAQSWLASFHQQAKAALELEINDLPVA